MMASTRSDAAWTVLRLVLAGLVAAHGGYRLFTGGSVPFGEWLVAQHVPLGAAGAWTVTLVEVAGAALLALGRLVFPTTLVLAAIYAVGIALVHAPEGWFVVGAGRNGAEYSVLLIVTLLCVGAQAAPGRRAS